MNTEQMLERVPGAQPLGWATLRGYRLTWEGRSASWGGGAVCNVRHERGCFVRGVVWELPRDGLQALDQYEGAPRVYRRQQMRLTLALHSDVETWATVYVLGSLREAPGEPSMEYLETVLEGYRKYVDAAATTAADLDGRK